MTARRQQRPDGHQESARSCASQSPNPDHFGTTDRTEFVRGTLILMSNGSAKKCSQSINEPRILLRNGGLNQSDPTAVRPLEPIPTDGAFPFKDASGPSDKNHRWMLGCHQLRIAFAAAIRIAFSSFPVLATARGCLDESIALTKNFFATIASKFEKRTALRTSHNPSFVRDYSQQSKSHSDVIFDRILVSRWCWHFSRSSSYQPILCQMENQ